MFRHLLAEYLCSGSRRCPIHEIVVPSKYYRIVQRAVFSSIFIKLGRPKLTGGRKKSKTSKVSHSVHKAMKQILVLSCQRMPCTHVPRRNKTLFCKLVSKMQECRRSYVFLISGRILANFLPIPLPIQNNSLCAIRRLVKDCCRALDVFGGWCRAGVHLRN